MNVNVLNREMLLDAMDHPEKYPQPDDSRFGICSELRAADARAADGCNQSYVSRSADIDERGESARTSFARGEQSFRASRKPRRWRFRIGGEDSTTTGDMGFLHSFTTGSTVDGPGVRLVAWTAGCQWRCLYCHNPDTWNMMQRNAGHSRSRNRGACASIVMVSRSCRADSL